MQFLNQTKKTLLRSSSWFFTANILLFWILGYKYILSATWTGANILSKWQTLYIKVFLAVTYLAQLALLAYSPFILIALIILIFPKKNLTLILSALTAAFCAFLLICDVCVYSVFHFHLNGVILELVFNSANEQFFDFSSLEVLELTGIIIGLLLGEVFFAYLLWKRLSQQKFLQGAGKWVTLLIGMMVYLSYTSLIYKPNRFCLEVARIMPFYTEFVGAMLPGKNGQLALERAYEKNILQPDQVARPLQYPLHPLQFSQQKKPYNVLIIGIDTWRFDMLNPDVTPNIYQFAKKAIVFNQHFSGGDATAPGVFTLFYGIPATYWTSMALQHHAPLLLDELQKRHYQMKILVSAGLKLPPFKETVFQNVKNLPMELKGKDVYQRDLEVTHDFSQFLASRNPGKPFFSFLFYDSSHSYCRIKNNLKPFHPVLKDCNRFELTNSTDPLPYFNRYRNALHLVDVEVSKVLKELDEKHLLDNTIVLITGDHGEEFNDNHLGFWGHTSNFTHYQTQTPLIMYWPGMKPRRISYLTTHFDVAPTLMENLLGCKVAPEQYSIGHSLLSARTLPYVIEGSYIGLGIIEKDRIVNILPTGTFQITGLDGRVLQNARLNPDIMHAVYQDVTRFYAAK